MSGQQRQAIPATPETAPRAPTIEQIDAGTFPVPVIAFASGFKQEGAAELAREPALPTSALPYRTYRAKDVTLPAWVGQFLGELPALAAGIAATAAVQCAAFYPAGGKPAGRCVGLIAAKTRDEKHGTESDYVFRVGPGPAPVFSLLRLNGKLVVFDSLPCGQTPGVVLGTTFENSRTRISGVEGGAFNFDADPDPDPEAGVFFAVSPDGVEAYSVKTLALVRAFRFAFESPDTRIFESLAARGGKLYAASTTPAGGAEISVFSVAPDGGFQSKKFEAGVQWLEPLEGGQVLVFTCSGTLVLLDADLAPVWEETFVDETSSTECVVHPPAGPGGETVVFRTYTVSYRAVDWKVTVPH